MACNELFFPLHIEQVAACPPLVVEQALLFDLFIEQARVIVSHIEQAQVFTLEL